MRLFFVFSPFNDKVFFNTLSESEQLYLDSIDGQEIFTDAFYGIIPNIGDEINFSELIFVDEKINTLGDNKEDGYDYDFLLTDIKVIRRVFNEDGLTLWFDFA